MDSFEQQLETGLKTMQDRLAKLETRINLLIGTLVVFWLTVLAFVITFAILTTGR